MLWRTRDVVIAVSYSALFALFPPVEPQEKLADPDRSQLRTGPTERRWPALPPESGLHATQFFRRSDHAELAEDDAVLGRRCIPPEMFKERLFCAYCLNSAGGYLHKITQADHSRDESCRQDEPRLAQRTDEMRFREKPTEQADRRYHALATG